MRAVTNGGASLEAILDCVALPVWVVDHDGLVVLANPAALGGAAATAAGTGLAGLADRVAALDGELTITSLPGAGTTLHAVIPLG